MRLEDDYHYAMQQEAREDAYYERMKAEEERAWWLAEADLIGETY